MSNEFWDFLGALPSLIFLVGIIIIIWIFTRHNYLRKIDYFFSKMIFKSKNILIGEYWRGFDEKYDKYTFIYLVLTNEGIIICPIFYRHRTFIPYEKIMKFEYVLKEASDIDENQFPLRFKDLQFILIDYIMDNLKKDSITLSFYNGKKHVKFNDYVYSKHGFFEKIKSQIPDKVIQSFDTKKRAY